MIEAVALMVESPKPKATIRLSDEKRKDILNHVPAHMLSHGKGVEYGRAITWMVDAAWPLFVASGFNPGIVSAEIEKLTSGNPVKDWLFALYEATPPDQRGAFRGIADRIHFDVPPPEEFDEGQSRVPKTADAGVGRKPERRGRR